MTYGERKWGDEPVVDLKPIVVVPMCAVPDGKMPATATHIVRLALECGMKVWSTYAVALVPNVLRAKQRVTLTLESVAVRFRKDGRRGYAVWHNGQFAEAATMLAGSWPVKRGMEDTRPKDDTVTPVQGVKNWIRSK